MSKSVRIFQTIFLSFLLLLPTVTVFAEGLPIFWWKEGDFINFGDHIAYKIIERIVGCPLDYYNKKTPNQKKKLLGLGSVFYFANEGDVIWGSGINGKRPNKSDYAFSSLDIRAVRGPLTREFLKRNFNIEAPEIYGDPALLIPYLFPEFQKPKHPKNDYLIVVHYLDIPYFLDTNREFVVFSTEPWDRIVQAILNSKFVISTSLHGLVIAESYGIPARYLRISNHEPLIKFEDYYLGSGRTSSTFATSILEALWMGGEPPIQCDLERLYQAFPFEFWPNQTFKPIDFSKKDSP